MWSDDPQNLAQLAYWLGEQGLTATWDHLDWARYMEKGRDWTTEWNDMQAELREDEVAA